MAERSSAQAASTQFNDAWLEAQNPSLQQRVTMAIVKYARDVNVEAPDTENHNMRMQLATQVVRSPSMFTQSFTLMVTAQGVTSQSSDDEITGWVHQAWDVMAGREYIPAPIPTSARPPNGGPRPNGGPPPNGGPHQ